MHCRMRFDASALVALVFYQYRGYCNCTSLLYTEGYGCHWSGLVIPVILESFAIRTQHSSWIYSLIDLEREKGLINCRNLPLQGLVWIKVISRRICQWANQEFPNLEVRTPQKAQEESTDSPVKQYNICFLFWFSFSSCKILDTINSWTSNKPPY